MTKLTGQEFHFLNGGGEMGVLTRGVDWTNTSLGGIATWPQSLRTTLGIVLHSAFPMFLFWGEDLICFYNDAFRPSLGEKGKHPAVGKKGREVWEDIWDFAGPLILKVMNTGEPVFFENQLVPFFRNGRTEEIYWTFSYGPAYGDKGQVNGVFVTCTETTASMVTMQRLRESDQRFNSLIRNATVGIVVLLGENNVAEIVNDTYAGIINRDRSAVIGKPIFDVIPETEPFFKKIIDDVRSTGKDHYLYEHPYYILTGDDRKDGYLNLVYQPYRTDDNVIAGVMVLCQDVTDQVSARKQIEEKESQVRSIVESAPFPIGVYIGKEMRIELVNQSIINTWGKGQHVVGKTYSEVLPELDETIYSQLDQVFETGKPFHARNQRVDLVVDGTLQPFYFNYSFTPLYDGAGKIYGVMNTAADVTDLKVAMQKVEQSENMIRTMILQAPVAMCIMLGPAHVIDIANELMIELWGKPPETVMGKPVFDALPDARSQGLEELLSQVYQTGESFVARERPVLLQRNGKLDTVYQNFVYEAYRDTSGKIVGVLAISVDVTDQVLARHKIEEIVAERTKALAEVNVNLKRSNADLAQFAYIASHDLQEPVRKVSTFAEMLETHLGELDTRGKNYLEKIKNSSKRMMALIKDVLAFSELTRPNIVFEKVPLNAVIEEVMTDFELIIEQKKAKITVDELPSIEAIPLQMYQLFRNLLSNALKFTKPGTIPEISFRSRTIDAIDGKAGENAAGYVEITVTDNGIGFSEVHSKQIFNIFQRLHGKSEYEGTGIGLAMCQKIASLHNGEIYANSVPGSGSSFVIILPVSGRAERHVKEPAN